MTLAQTNIGNALDGLMFNLVLGAADQGDAQGDTKPEGNQQQRTTIPD